MNEIVFAWRQYNEAETNLSNLLGRTRNVVGEYAEFLINEFLQGELLNASTNSADIKTKNNQLYQVKSRKIKNDTATQLNVIRSWDFDFLAVILFDFLGNIRKALICPVEIAKQFAVPNKHQNGHVITTTASFLNHHMINDITNEIRLLNEETLVDSYQASNKLKSPDIIGKSHALLILRESFPALNNSNLVFSNINKSVDIWWFEPSHVKHKSGYFLCLNDPTKKSLYLFKIPPNVVDDPENHFYTRRDKECYSFGIKRTDTRNFTDIKHPKAMFKFSPYKIGTINY